MFFSKEKKAARKKARQEREAQHRLEQEKFQRRVKRTSTFPKIKKHRHTKQLIENTWYRIPSVLIWCENCDRTAKGSRHKPESLHKVKFQCPHCDSSNWIRLYYLPCCVKAKI